MSKKATVQELAEVHNGLAQWCKTILQGVPLMAEGKPVLKPDGQPWLIPPSPAHLNVIRQFLKDNKIESPESEELGDAAKGLDDLPVFDDDSIVPIRRTK